VAAVCLSNSLKLVEDKTNTEEKMKSILLSVENSKILYDFALNEIAARQVVEFMTRYSLHGVIPLAGFHIEISKHRARLKSVMQTKEAELD